jgi:hypothetical protein
MGKSKVTPLGRKIQVAHTDAEQYAEKITDKFTTLITDTEDSTTDSNLGNSLTAL